MKGQKKAYEKSGDWNSMNVSNIDDDLKAVVTAIGNTSSTQKEIVEVARFNLQGVRINGQQPGVNIIKMSDGTIKKVLVK